MGTETTDEGANALTLKAPESLVDSVGRAPGVTKGTKRPSCVDAKVSQWALPVDVAHTKDQGVTHVLSPCPRMPDRSCLRRAAQLGVGSMPAAARDKLLAELLARDPCGLKSLKQGKSASG